MAVSSSACAAAGHIRGGGGRVAARWCLHFGGMFFSMTLMVFNVPPFWRPFRLISDGRPPPFSSIVTATWSRPRA